MTWPSSCNVARRPVSNSLVGCNRVEGKPVAMTVHITTGDLSALSDADLDHELRLHAARIREDTEKN